MRTLLLLLLSVLFISKASAALAAYSPSPAATNSRAVVATAAESHTAKPFPTRAERRLKKLLLRIHRALPVEGEEKTDIHSLLSIVFGVASLVGLFIFPYLSILAIPALILGIIGLRKTTPDGLRGRGLAIAGIVTGGLTLLLGIIASILVVLLLLAIL